MGSVQGNMVMDEVVTAEVDQPAGPLPSNYTLDRSTSSDFITVKPGTVSVVLEDSSASTNITLDQGTDYVVYNDAGNVELQSSPGGVSYDDTSDQVYTDYTAEVEDTQAREGASNAISGMNEILGFLPVIGLVVAAAVVIGLVSGFGSNGGQRMRA